MPLIQVKTSVTQPESKVIESLLTTLSAKLAQHLGKPESYVMTSFDSDIKMTFSGTFDPVCYLEIKSVGGMSPSKTKSMSKDFCQVIEDELGVPKNRTYIEFAGAEGSMWGWNGSTF
ncbi:phenylpyruvate tautomerase MIF-related protein [Crocosphaera sp.]|uniref:phenylpyruvate tautomerase MIF-related protein n=1 Tax=Crocosphaera sp. TaxID=2729996 RepID=UPI003F29D82B|nr:phenylpyruvate tautomerase MIF-related protein [Crocosphaera sp.]